MEDNLDEEVSKGYISTNLISSHFGSQNNRVSDRHRIERARSTVAKTVIINPTATSENKLMEAYQSRKLLKNKFD